jgi:hypothetical protein
MQFRNSPPAQHRGKICIRAVKPAEIQLVMPRHIAALVRQLTPPQPFNTALVENTLDNALFKRQLPLKPDSVGVLAVLVKQLAKKLIAVHVLLKRNAVRVTNHVTYFLQVTVDLRWQITVLNQPAAMLIDFPNQHFRGLTFDRRSKFRLLFGQRK